MELIMVTQKVVITNTEGRILALRRSKTDPTKPLGWDLPGGVVEEGEDLRLSMLREVEEETGMAVGELRQLEAFGYTNEAGKYLVCIGYVCEAASGDVVLSYEHDMFEWLTREEFLERDSKGHIKELVRRV